MRRGSAAPGNMRISLADIGDENKSIAAKLDHASLAQLDGVTSISNKVKKQKTPVVLMSSPNGLNKVHLYITKHIVKAQY